MHLSYFTPFLCRRSKCQNQRRCGLWLVACRVPPPLPFVAWILRVFRPHCHREEQQSTLAAPTSAAAAQPTATVMPGMTTFPASHEPTVVRVALIEKHKSQISLPVNSFNIFVLVVPGRLLCRTRTEIACLPPCLCSPACLNGKTGPGQRQCLANRGASARPAEATAAR